MGTLVGYLAEILGAPEPALRLLLSILSGYPLAALYRSYIQGKQAKLIINCYFIFCGISLCIFNYGYDVYHSIISISITYILIKLFENNRQYLVISNFIFQMSYLLIGYYYTESDDYDIKWTMPHCVLVLRLIGIGFDIGDRQLPMDELSATQKDVLINELPNIFELFGFAYFPASFLVGPQFSFKRYQRFINGDFIKYNGNEKAALYRVGFGFLYLILRQIGSIYIPDSYLLTDNNHSFIWKLFLLGLWGKISLYKYISCWLLAEGALIYFGVTYCNKLSSSKEIDDISNNKRNENKDESENWYGCSNVRLSIFENTTKMSHYVDAFNVNTNNWLANYVYKRLKFLNNRNLSYFGALMFLAVWHGFHSGYYMCFLLEFIVVTMERQIEPFLQNILGMKYFSAFSSSICFKFLKSILLRIYTFICMGWCLVPFIHLNYSKWMKVYSHIYYIGYIIYAIWFLFYFLYMKFYVKPKRKANNNDNESDINKMKLK